MNVNLSNIKSKAINGLNSVGSTAYTIKDKAVDFAHQAKNKIASSDVFTRVNDGLKSHGIEKKTLVGGAVIGCALILAGKSIKSIVNKIKDIKTK